MITTCRILWMPETLDAALDPVVAAALAAATTKPNPPVAIRRHSSEIAPTAPRYARGGELSTGKRATSDALGSVVDGSGIGWHVDRVLLEQLHRHHIERALVRAREDDVGPHPGFVCA